MSNALGRPRQFDMDDAIESALQVFWRHGYQGSSLSELTRAMGLTRPSLYAAYGDKEGLYVRALQRYVEQRLAPLLTALEAESDFQRGITALLRSFARLFSEGGGCLVINGLADVGGPTTPPQVGKTLLQVLAQSEAQVRARVIRAQREGRLHEQGTPSDVSGFVMLLMAGLAMRAKAGIPLRQLEKVITLSLAQLPFV